MYLFVIPLVLGFVLCGASAFTAAYSRRWGEGGGKAVTSLLRNVLGIPLWLFGFIWAWRVTTVPLFTPGGIAVVLGWLLIIAGSIPVVWGHLVVGWRTHMPSVRDTLVRHDLYAHVRHPIYAGGMAILVGLAVLNPTAPFALACGLCTVWLLIQARLEEIDLLQRLPGYRDY